MGTYNSRHTGSAIDSAIDVVNALPSWSKASTKPTYTAQEVGALPDDTAIPTKTSDLTNDSGFLTSHQSLAAYRTSAAQDVIDAGKVDKTDYNPTSKTSAMTQAVGKDSDGKLWTTPGGGGGGGAVDSVNGKTGVVVLDAEDVGAATASHTHAQSDITGLETALNGKASSSELSSHTGDNTIHVTSSDKSAWNGKYSKPSSGIPKTDLASDVQTSLGKADSALQAHQDISGKVDKTTTVNGHALSGNVTVTASDVGADTSGQITIGGTTYTVRVGTEGVAGYLTFVLE